MNQSKEVSVKSFNIPSGELPHMPTPWEIDEHYEREPWMVKYEEIQNLAKLAFPNDEVNIQASIFGNNYEVVIGGRDVISGTSQSVRATLLNVQKVVSL